LQIETGTGGAKRVITHAPRLGAERADQLAVTVTVAEPLGLVAAPVARTPERLGELLFEHRLDGAPHHRPQPILDRVVAFVMRR
jgi:hypothetical protein